MCRTIQKVERRIHYILFLSLSVVFLCVCAIVGELLGRDVEDRTYITYVN